MFNLASNVFKLEQRPAGVDVFPYDESTFVAPFFGNRVEFWSFGVDGFCKELLLVVVAAIITGGGKDLVNGVLKRGVLQLVFCVYLDHLIFSPMYNITCDLSRLPYICCSFDCKHLVEREVELCIGWP